MSVRGFQPDQVTYDVLIAVATFQWYLVIPAGDQIQKSSGIGLGVRCRNWYQNLQKLVNAELTVRKIHECEDLIWFSGTQFGSTCFPETFMGLAVAGPTE
jgi:hypothetical protein